MEKITAGSGKLYLVEYTGTIPTDETIETDANLLGAIYKGASVQYTPQHVTYKDDLGTISREFLTDEEVIFKSGVLAWNASHLNKLISTGTLTETTSLRTLKIGGISNQNDKKYLIHFLHEDSEKGDIRIQIIGNNKSGFELSFNNDNPVSVNAEFKAMPLDSTGTLLIYREEIIAA